MTYQKLNPRKRIAEMLEMDGTRRGVANDRVHLCEGQSFKPHECQTRIELNEVIFPRNRFQHLTESQKDYFWHIFNCSLNCQWFHSKWGHTTEFRAWFVNRMIAKEGQHSVALYIRNAPLRCPEFAWVYAPFSEADDPKPIPIFTEGGQRVASVLDGTMFKLVKSLHMLNKPAGWAFDKHIIQTATDLAVEEIVIENVDNGQVYRTTLANFKAKGIEINRGHNVQIVLPLQYWNTEATGQKVLWEQLDTKE